MCYTCFHQTEIIDLMIDQNQSLLHMNNCNKETPPHIAAKLGKKDSAFIFIERLNVTFIGRDLQ